MLFHITLATFHFGVWCLKYVCLECDLTFEELLLFQGYFRLPIFLHPSEESSQNSWSINSIASSIQGTKGVY